MQAKILWNKFYTKKIRIITHLVFWILISIFYYLSYKRYDSGLAWLLTSKDLFVVITIFYSTSYIIIPKWLLKGKFVPSILWLVLTYVWWAVATYCMCFLIKEYFRPNPTLMIYINVVLDKGLSTIFNWTEIPFYVFDYVYLVSLPVGLKLMQALMNQSLQKITLERDNLNLELNFLKSQINPHFLFNSLNNIYRMINKEDPKSGDTVLSLANLMRYTLYESDALSVPLTNEVNFIKDFLELERLRYSLQVEIKHYIKLDDPNSFIAPLILFPFIENAFKHGLGKSQKNAWVHIDLGVNNNLLELKVSNSVSKKNSKTVGGVGIANARKRLELNYKNNYNLIAHESANNYTILLRINLNQQIQSANEYKLHTNR